MTTEVFGPWNPGIESTLPRRLLPLVTLYRPENAIGVALLLWLVTRDPRYLRFIGLTLKFTIIVLVAILMWFAAERLLAPMLGPLI